MYICMLYSQFIIKFVMIILIRNTEANSLPKDGHSSFPFYGAAVGSPFLFLVLIATALVLLLASKSTVANLIMGALVSFNHLC